MKKLLSMLLVVAMLCGMYVVPVGAEDLTEYINQYKYDPTEVFNLKLGLDGDWVEDEIKIYQNEVNGNHNINDITVEVNDKKYVSRPPLGWLHGTVIILDIDNSDNAKEILIKEGYHSASWYQLFRYENSELNLLQFNVNGEIQDYSAFRKDSYEDSVTANIDRVLSISGTAWDSNNANFTVITDRYQEIERGILTKFDGEPTDLSNAYHTDFSKYPSLILDSFVQTDSPTPKERLSDLAWCMDAENGLTYKDLLKTDFKNTIIKMFDIFTVGQVTENQFEIASKYFPNEIGRPYKIFKKDEIDMLFNLYFNTSIDVLSLPDEYDETDFCYIDIFNDYFVFFGDYLVTDLQQAKWAGGCVINDCTYWKWVLCEGGSYSSPVISDTIHTVEKYTSMYGYDFYAVQYIGFEPPSSEMVKSYEYGTSGLISVKLNNKRIAFDQPPILVNDRTLVPMRAIFEAMDCDVEWNEDSQSVTVSKDFDDIMILWIDDTEMWTQDGYVTLDVPPQIVNDRTLVPVRAISEALNCDVDWDEDTRTVVITSNSNVYNIEDIVFENTNEDVLREIFGEPDKKGNKHMELYTGYFYQDWNYDKQGICFRMCSESENGEQYVDGCFISAPSNLKLKTGIGIGSTKKELLQKYSEPETYGNTLNIIFENENGISFGLENDYISSIHIGSLFE